MPVRCKLQARERKSEMIFTEQLRDVKLKREKPINHHFGMKGHSEKDAKIAVLEKLYGGEKIERQLKEGIWIQKLATVRPDGCNTINSVRVTKWRKTMSWRQNSSIS